MKLNRIQKTYIVIALIAMMGFSWAGSRGFRLLSVFSVVATTHTGPPGVHHK